MPADLRPSADSGSSVRRTGVIKRSLVVAGHRTSISLEDAFWGGLKALAERRSQSINALVAEIDAARGQANLSSAIRLFVLESAAQ
jgi:predicted DNA-binding ribbon-helix-helix protein